MKYLVTGGAGFIGSNLVKRLLEERHKVSVIDALTTGSLDNLPIGVTPNKGTCKEVLTYPMDTPFDGIFHLGIASSSPIYQKDKRYMVQALEDFIYILNFAESRSIKVVYASSSSIYSGNPIPWKESMPTFVTDFYTEARYSMERLATLYNQLYGVQSIGLRLFSVYGPGESAKKGFANVLTQMLWKKQAGEEFEIYGDGEQMRDLTYVSDVVDTFILAMNSSKNGIFNVGTGMSYSYNQMAKMIGVKVKYVENPITNYVQDTLADPYGIFQELGLRTKVPLEEGIKLIEEAYG